MSRGPRAAIRCRNSSRISASGRRRAARVAERVAAELVRLRPDAVDLVERDAEARVGLGDADGAAGVDAAAEDADDGHVVKPRRGVGGPQQGRADEQGTGDEAEHQSVDRRFEVVVFEPDAEPPAVGGGGHVAEVPRQGLDQFVPVA